MQTCIQDHPCLYYTKRGKVKQGVQIRGFPRLHLCKVCEEEYNDDAELLERRNFRGGTTYYDEQGQFTSNPNLIRSIQCSFQGLRRLAIQKVLSKEDSFVKCRAEGRSIKVNSFTNAKLCPVWYYKLYIPTDNMDEIMMNADCAQLLLGLLWPDIREMLLTEIHFEEKFVKGRVYYFIKYFKFLLFYLVS